MPSRLASRACAVLLGFAFMIALASPAEARQSSDKFADTLSKAREALAARDFAAAERVAFALTVLDPERWEGHLAYGAALLGAGKLDEAREAFATARSAPPEVALLAELALGAALSQPEAVPTESADAAAAPGASESSPVAPEEQLTARERTRVASARSIASDINRERDPAKRAALLAELMSATATVPSARGPRVEMLFLRTLAAIELDDGDAGWNAARELRKLGAFESAEPAYADIVARVERKGWDADKKPDFVGEKRAKLEAELAKIKSEFKRVHERTVDVAYESGDAVDRFRWNPSVTRLEFQGRDLVRIDVFKRRQRIAGKPDEFDFDGTVVHQLFDVRGFSESRENWSEISPAEAAEDWLSVPPGTVRLSIQGMQDRLRLVSLFGLPEEASKGRKWREGANSQGFGGVSHSSRLGISGVYGKSQADAAALVTILSRWKAIVLELDALDAKAAAQPGGAQ
ncbi:MAG: hypothetical protein QM516_00450 [Limnohabitans sp.]|nr:hypothetical protein [Limnohabitans sp.]